MLTFDVSTLYHIYMCMCVNCWIQIKSLCPRLDFSEAEIYVSLNAKPKPCIFSPDSSHWVEDKSDKRSETCARVSERWRQQLRHNTLHLSGDTKTPWCPLVPYGRGWSCCRDLQLLGIGSFLVHGGRALPLTKWEEMGVMAGLRIHPVAFCSVWEGLFPPLALGQGFAVCLVACSKL